MMWVDIGHDHAYSLYGAHGGDGTTIGALVKHPLHDDDEQCRWRGECVGSILFRLPEAEPHAVYQTEDGNTGRRAQWDLLSLDPFHVEPSLACHCGDHGFIRGGLWEVA
jgi:hypothetical protein